MATHDHFSVFGCIVLFVIKGLLVPASGDQEFINYLSDNLDIQYEVVNNLADTWKTFEARLTLTNTGDEAIPKDHDWSMYFCHIRLIEPDNIRQSGGVQLGGTGLKVYHVNGCLHKIRPTSDFGGIAAGHELEVPFRAQYWQVAKTDVMPNWYVTSADALPRVVKATETLGFVKEFTTPKMTKRIEEDTYSPYTAEDRFALRQDYKDQGSSPGGVIPTPRDIDLNPNVTLTLDPDVWVVVAVASSVTTHATYLADKLGAKVAISLPDSRYISLDVQDANQLEGPEAYTLDMKPDREAIRIVGGGPAGIFYGIQTLLSLLEGGLNIPSGSIKDSPRFAYRGMHLDVARNFHTVESVRKLLDVMAMYKLNKLHLHLTDDEGWRLQIPGLEELTVVGSKRCHDLTGDECILPQLGSSPTATGAQFYTTEEYRDILRYADARHIQVIPEFDMPGHAHAAIHAMLARNRNLSNDEFVISDVSDPSDYLSVQYFTDNAINPCVGGTKKFIEHLIKSVKTMHADIQPLETFHFGGDEVPDGAWINSTACRDLGLDTGEKVKESFLSLVSELAGGEGLTLSGWEDGYRRNTSTVYPPSDLDVDTAYSYVWNNVWEWGGAQNTNVFANLGYKVVLCHATHLYFDHPTEPNPDERGFYWATRISPARKTFSYMPLDVYANIDVGRMGGPLTKEDVCGECGELKQESKENIIGMQGQLWSETVRTSAQLDSMIFPRLLALAERAWHQAPWETVTDVEDRQIEQTRDWEKFANTLGHKELARLDRLGVLYGINPPGARLSGGKLEAIAEFPGSPIQYRLMKGTRVVQTWKNYTGPVQIPASSDATTIELVTKSADGTRSTQAAVVQDNREKPTSGGVVSAQRWSVWAVLVITMGIIA